MALAELRQPASRYGVSLSHFTKVFAFSRLGVSMVTFPLCMIAQGASGYRSIQTPTSVMPASAS